MSTRLSTKSEQAKNYRKHNPTIKRFRHLLINYDAKYVIDQELWIEFSDPNQLTLFLLEWS